MVLMKIILSIKRFSLFYLISKENDMISKEEENRNMESLIINEKSKATELLKHIEDITFINNELSGKQKEAKIKYDELETVIIFCYSFILIKK